MIGRISRCAMLMAVAGTMVTVGPVVAEEFPRTELKMAGLESNHTIHKDIVGPYFNKTISQKTNGTITVDYKSSDILGLKTTSVIRMLKLGVFDFGIAGISHLAGDDPRFEGLDLPGLTVDIDTTRKVVDAYKPVVSRVAEQKFNTKILVVFPIATQVWYCRDPIEGLADVKGRKVRVFNRSMADFVEAAGGASINISFTEVLPALHRGVADCALTGTSAGNTVRWWEATHYLYTMPMGWGMTYIGVNVNSWNKMDPKVRAFLESEFAALEDRIWTRSAEDVQDGIDCNLGLEKCKNGIRADKPMKWVKVSDADMALHKKIVEETVIARWAERCGSDCAKEWNETIGKIVGMKAPVN